MPNWENNADDDECCFDNSDDYAIWKHDLGWRENLEIEDARMFMRSIGVIRYYIKSVHTLPTTDLPIQPDFLQKDLTLQSDKISTMKHIMDILRGMLNWSYTSVPYRELCRNKGSWKEDMKIDIYDVIITWEQICRHLENTK